MPTSIFLSVFRSFMTAINVCMGTCVFKKFTPAFGITLSSIVGVKNGTSLIEKWNIFD